MNHTKAQSSIERLSIAAAVSACICNLSCLVLLIYQDYLRTETIAANYLEIISDYFLLLPMIVVIIFRRVAALTFIYASILSVVLAGRIYYLVQFDLIGIGASEPRLDLPGLLLISLGIVSLVIILIWAIIRLTALLGFRSETPRSISNSN